MCQCCIALGYRHSGHESVLPGNYYSQYSRLLLGLSVYLSQGTVHSQCQLSVAHCSTIAGIVFLWIIAARTRKLGAVIPRPLNIHTSECVFSGLFQFPLLHTSFYKIFRLHPCQSSHPDEKTASLSYCCLGSHHVAKQLAHGKTQAPETVPYEGIFNIYCGQLSYLWICLYHGWGYCILERLSHLLKITSFLIKKKFKDLFN